MFSLYTRSKFSLLAYFVPVGQTIGERTSFRSNNALLLEAWLSTRNMAKSGRYMNINSHVQVLYVYVHRHRDIICVYLCFMFSYVTMCSWEAENEVRDKDQSKVGKSKTDALKEHKHKQFWKHK